MLGIPSETPSPICNGQTNFSISYAPPLDAAANAYAQRLLALPSMQDWYRAALAETWRDAAHDAEVTEWGAITEDLRAV